MDRQWVCLLQVSGKLIVHMEKQLQRVWRIKGRKKNEQKEIIMLKLFL